VGGDGAADSLVSDAHIGHLRGHADHEGEIYEIPIVGIVMPVAAGKLEPAGLVATVILVRVMQRERRVHRRPRQSDRKDRKDQLLRIAMGPAEF